MKSCFFDFKKCVHRGKLACAVALTLGLASWASAADLPAGCHLVSAASVGSKPAPSGSPPFPPIQLALRTPHRPVPVPGADHQYLVYEVHAQNYSDHQISLNRLDVVDGDDHTRRLASLEGPALSEQTLAYGADANEAKRALGAGRTAVFLMCLAWHKGAPMPQAIRHQWNGSEGRADGPRIELDAKSAVVLDAPVSGAHWLAKNGPDIHSHHRKGLFVAGGLAHLSRRFAVDWLRLVDGKSFAGDPAELRSHHSYGQAVYAVAGARVVLARDGLPDNVPRTSAGFKTAIPITHDSVAGNAVILDLGNDRFAYYAHLRPGSVRVKVGDLVRPGQILAEIGNSGDARVPHLHFQISDRPDILASEGLPFVLKRFVTATPTGGTVQHDHEFPFGNIELELMAIPG